MSSRPQLSETQRRALMRLGALRFGGALELDVSGTTIEALVRRGLAVSALTTHPHRRIVGRLTQAGVELRRELRLDELQAELRGPDGWLRMPVDRLIELHIAGRITDRDLFGELDRRGELERQRHRERVLDVLIVDRLEAAGQEGIAPDDLERVVRAADFDLEPDELDRSLARLAPYLRHAPDRITVRVYPTTPGGTS